nr:MAG TPA: hypothetical protein [Caudoviricetes sp.]
MAAKSYTSSDIEEINASYTPIGTLPTTLDKDTSEHKRWEDVSYRYRLYKKNGIYLSLTVNRIEEVRLSKRVSDYVGNRNKKEMAAELAGLTKKTVNAGSYNESKNVRGFIDTLTYLDFTKDTITVLHDVEYAGNKLDITDALTQLNKAKTNNADTAVSYTCSCSGGSVSVTYHPAYTMEFPDGTILNFTEVMTALANSSATDDTKLDAFLKTSVSYKNGTAPAVKSCEVATKADLAGLPQTTFSKLAAYVKDEDTYYQYNSTINDWLAYPGATCIYSAQFYIMYRNDNTEEVYYNFYESQMPQWKSIDEAKKELASLSFEYLDFAADDGLTFYIVDPSQSKLLDANQYNALRGLGEYKGFGYYGYQNSITIYPTQLVPKAKGVAYVISIKNKADATWSVPEHYMKDSAGIARTQIVEGVQTNGGKSRISYLLRRWKKLDTDSSEYLALADATKSSGYAKINTGAS